MSFTLRRKSLAVAGALLLGAQAGVLLHVVRTRRQIAASRVEPADVSIDPARIDLGTVPLGSHHLMHARVENVSGREIELLCDHNCKCLKASLVPPVLPPRGVAMATFELHVPAVPQAIERHVRLLSKAGQLVGGGPSSQSQQSSISMP